MVTEDLKAFWESLLKEPSAASQRSGLTEDETLLKTFFETYEALKAARKVRKISIKDFLKGLVEVIKALSQFVQYENCFDEKEKKMQISVLQGYLETLFDFMREEMEIKSLYEPSYKVMKEVRKEGLIDLDFYWKKLILFVIALTEEIHDLDVPDEKIRYLIPFLVSFLKFYQWTLVEKRLHAVESDSTN